MSDVFVPCGLCGFVGFHYCTGKNPSTAPRIDSWPDSPHECAATAEVERLRAQLAEAFDQGFGAGRSYESEYIEWWDNYDDDLDAHDNEPRPYLPVNPFRGEQP